VGGNVGFNLRFNLICGLINFDRGFAVEYK
jgi:hypothetical protein